MRLIKDNVERVVDNEAKAAKLKAQGYKEVTDAAEKSEAQKGKDISEMKVTELRAIAKEKGIEGADSLTKTELLDILKGCEPDGGASEA